VLEMTAMDKLEDHNPTEAISPSLAPGHRRFSLRVATGILCFVLSLLFYYGAVLRVEFKRTDLLDLGPYTDAVEYFAQANSILKDGEPTIRIGYDRLPSRYPPGYPVLMIPWLRFLPHNGILAPLEQIRRSACCYWLAALCFILRSEGRSPEDWRPCWSQLNQRSLPLADHR